MSRQQDNFYVDVGHISTFNSDSEIDVLEEKLERLTLAAQAVVDRWDNVDWKSPPTAEIINRLRKALLDNK